MTRMRVGHQKPKQIGYNIKHQEIMQLKDAYILKNNFLRRLKSSYLCSAYQTQIRAILKLNRSLTHELKNTRSSMFKLFSPLSIIATGYSSLVCALPSL